MNELGTPPVRRVEMHLCDPCLDGEGGECHVPGCSFWMSDAPTGLPLRERQRVTVLDTQSRGEVAYAAYSLARMRQHPTRRYAPWDELDLQEQAAWEAAANVVYGPAQ